MFREIHKAQNVPYGWLRAPSILFHQPSTWAEFYSGVGAWIASVLLATNGIFIARLRKSPMRAKAVRISHIALTAEYAGAILLHVQGSIFLAGILFTAAFTAVMVMWGLVRLTATTLGLIRK